MSKVSEGLKAHQNENARAMAAQSREWARQDLWELFGNVANSFKVSEGSPLPYARSGTVTSKSGGVVVYMYNPRWGHGLEYRDAHNFRLYRNRKNRFLSLFRLPLSAAKAARILDGK